MINVWQYLEALRNRRMYILGLFLSIICLSIMFYVITIGHRTIDAMCITLIMIFDMLIVILSFGIMSSNKYIKQYRSTHPTIN